MILLKDIFFNILDNRFNFLLHLSKKWFYNQKTFNKSKTFILRGKTKYLSLI